MSNIDKLSADELSELKNLQTRNLDEIKVRLRREGKLVAFLKDPKDWDYLESSINRGIINNEALRLANKRERYDSVHDVKNNMKDSVGGLFKSAKKWWDR